MASAKKGSRSSGSSPGGRPPERKEAIREAASSAAPERETQAKLDETLRELYALRAKVAEAERVLREKRSPAKALELLGIKRPRIARGPQGEGHGRRGRSRQELDRIVGLYLNMRTTDYGGRPRYGRGERHDLLFRMAAGDDVSAEFVFEPDTDPPMSKTDALRNVAAYLAVSPRQAWEILAREAKRPPQADREPFTLADLPPRPR
ncbi:MAG: hypothetical protein IT386_16385 [Deltaproteobacteria bacterium]|nr:hypothetical protein [Deltaproteobacteria bacterium]